MSDQPQRWTWSYVEELYNANGIMGITAAHNAALDAASKLEDERLEQMAMTIRTLEQQLSSEREWSKALYRNLEDEKKSHRKTLDALAAELENRDKWWRERTSGERVLKLEEQLKTVRELREFDQKTIQQLKANT